MKKQFMEPEIVRIQLNLTENIAQSEHYGPGYNVLGITAKTKLDVADCDKIFVDTEPPLSTEGYNTKDPNEIVIQIALGRCFINPLEQARAMMTYGIR